MSAEPGRKTAYSNDLRWRIDRYIRCTVLTATFKFCAIFTSGRFIAIL